MNLEIEKIRASFPALTQKIRGKSWIYFDSAATALKPWSVIERISHFYSYETANVHRGAFFLADQGTQFFEATREKVREFLGAVSSEQIIFTKGTTESVNFVAQAWGLDHLKAGDEVLVSEMEHHANIVPWQIVCEQTGALLKVLPITDNGEIELNQVIRCLNPRTKLLAITHCSNVLGSVNDIKAIAREAHQNGTLIFVDGAQMVANFPVDVQALDVDFYAFSGHKIFGPYGVGVLYGKRELLEKLRPYQGGGSMISEVRFEHTSYNELPYKFEAGTPNIEGVIALGTALDYVKNIGFEKIHSIESSLLNYATAELLKIPGLRIYGQALQKAPIISFSIVGCHHSDLAQILDQENIAVRAGHLCAQPLLRRLACTGFVRVSFSIFNSKKEIDLLVCALKKAMELLV